MNIWDELGLEPTTDRARIRRAYAERLKQVHPEDDPEGFQRLRQAYEKALNPAVDVDRLEPWPVAQEASDAAQRPDRGAEPQVPRRDLMVVAAAADAVMDKLAQDDSGGALSVLDQALRDPSLAALESRRVLEQRLLSEIDPDREVPTALIDALAAAFDWRDDPSHLPPMAQQRARDLLAEREARTRLAALRRERRRWHRLLLFDKGPVAAALLLGPSRPRLFALLAVDRQIFRTAMDLVCDLDRLRPALLDRELDPDTAAWWRRARYRPRGRFLGLLGYLLDARWLYLALALAALKLSGIAVSQWIAIPVAGFMAYDLGKDLYPLILSGVGRAYAASRRLPVGARRAFLPTLALASLSTALAAPPPYDGFAGLAAFFSLLFMSADPEVDVLYYVLGTGALFWAATGLTGLGLLPALPAVPLLVAAQVSAFAALRLWRRTQRRTVPRHP